MSSQVLVRQDQLKEVFDQKLALLYDLCAMKDGLAQVGNVFYFFDIFLDILLDLDHLFVSNENLLNVVSNLYFRDVNSVLFLQF